MNILSKKRILLILFSVMVLLAGCKGPETIVIDQSPTAVAPGDTTEANNQTGNEASFRKMVIGEYLSIPTLDPLYADNAATMRAVQLVYEGLVRLDRSGNVVPAMATSWLVSSDSLTYTFQLRNNVYYQDSDIFSTGTGRKMTSSDVKYVFERMARSGVPPTAAHLFMNIRGFEPYFQEQHEVYIPSERKLDGVSGITTPGQNTVKIELTEAEPDFLKKLATPLAVIYPPEAVQNELGGFKPVGTGPFSFSSRNEQDGLIFSKFNNYYAASDIQLNRIDIKVNDSESQLFRDMGKGTIQLLPQLGPQLMKSLLEPNGNLIASYHDRYKLNVTNGTTDYSLRFNPGAGLNADSAQIISRYIKADTGSYFRKFPNELVIPQDTPGNTAGGSQLTKLNRTLYSAYSEDPFVRTFLGNVSTAISPDTMQLQMLEIRTPTRDTGFFFTKSYPLIPNAQWMNYRTLYHFGVRQAVLQRNLIDGLEFNRYPWWFNPRGVTLPPVESIN